MKINNKQRISHAIGINVTVQCCKAGNMEKRLIAILTLTFLGKIL